jgi:cyclopropane fatty-acyl-phospholipid synthase-like methyltransferase
MAGTDEGVIEEAAGLSARFPLPPPLADAYTLAGKAEFADVFTAARDEVEEAYYAAADRLTTPGARSRRFLAAMINPMIGRPMRDAEEFYQTFGRLMRRAWLSVSLGMYDPEIEAVADTARRLALAQVNTVDTNWLPAVSRVAGAAGAGLIVEVGTGRGNSVARLATLLPRARIVSITISPEQHEIAEAVVRTMGLTNVEIRRGDIFDPGVTEDLVGQADAVGAIEVVLHLPAEMKAAGMGMMTRLLKPNGALCLVDTAIAKPLGAFAVRYYANQSVHFGLREQYFALFEDAGLTPVAYVDHTPGMNRTFRETTQVLRTFRPQLRAEFGPAMSGLWPEIPARVYLRTIKNLRYVHTVALNR